MNKEDLNKINMFLARTDLVDTDLKLKESIFKTERSLRDAEKELTELSSSKMKKETDVFALAQRLESLVQLALEVKNLDTSDLKSDV